MHCHFLHPLIDYVNPAVVTWEVEQWSDNRLHSAPMDRIGETIPAMSMFYIYIAPQPIRTHDPDQKPP